MPVDARGYPTGHDAPGPGASSLTYDGDGGVTTRTLADGRNVAVSWDATGRITTSDGPDATTTFTYSPTVPNSLRMLRRTPDVGVAQDLVFTTDGSLITALQFAGPAAGRFDYTYGPEFEATGYRLTSGTTDVTVPTPLDEDGLPSGYGPFTFEPRRTGVGVEHGH